MARSRLLQVRCTAAEHDEIRRRAAASSAPDMSTYVRGLALEGWSGGAEEAGEPRRVSRSAPASCGASDEAEGPTDAPPPPERYGCPRCDFNALSPKVRCPFHALALEPL